jgi:hypothetical protein
MLEGDQQARVCMTLCRRAGKPTWWTSQGPTYEAEDTRDGKAALSNGEECLLLMAWSVWNQNAGERLTMDRVLRVLDNDNTSTVGSLLMALAEGSDAVERWLVDQKRQIAERERGRCGTVEGGRP